MIGDVLGHGSRCRGFHGLAKERIREMTQGTVKFFSAGKGYGFITPTDGGDDIFVHYSVIQSDGFRTLHEGDTVEYEMEDTPKGLRAKNVSVVK